MADELDELYEVKPDEFTALRTKLVAAAKKRGDADTAKQISAARKPTTAAWVVNRLALRDRDIRTRLAGLGERLKDAHAAMDGESIRALSAEQRRLVDDVARAAFEEAELADPSARAARRRHGNPAGRDRRPGRRVAARPVDQGRAVVRLRRVRRHHNGFHPDTQDRH